MKNVLLRLGVPALLAALVAMLRPPIAAAQDWPCRPQLAAAPSPGDGGDDPLAGVPVEGAVRLRIRSTSPADALPIAVPDPLALDASDPLGLRARIALTLRRDLELAGFFELLLPNRYFFDASDEGMTEATIQFDRWRAVNAQGLVKSAFRVAGGQVVLDLRLFDVDLDREVALDLETAPFSPDDLEAHIHAFAARVVGHYSGCLGPFGTPIAFVGEGADGNQEVYRVGLGDARPVALTHHHSLSVLPAWAGQEVVYTTYVNDNPDLAATDGTTTRFLSTRPGLNIGGSLSPDGADLAATLTLDGNAEIYLLSPSDGAIRDRLTDNRAEDGSPVWSPDGRRLAFESDRSGGLQIYLMNRDGSDQQRVTFAGAFNATPSWSPDGTRLAVTARDERNRLDVFVVDLASSMLERVTQDQGNNEDPSWSPDGRYLVFSSDRAGSRRLFVATVDGTFQVPLLTEGAGYHSPSWGR